MMKWVCLSWSQCQVSEVEEEQYAIDYDLMLVVQAVWLGGQGEGGGAIWKTKNILIECYGIVVLYYHFWLGGRGGGEEEVVKNQAVISISYQVWENILGYFPIT